MGVCESWLDETAFEACCDLGEVEIPDGQIETMLRSASDVLYVLSGRQFPGICTETIRPCRDCSCTPQACSCRVSKIHLPGEPAVSVEEVLIDGVALDPSEYRIDDSRDLVRLPDLEGNRPVWPCSQDLALDVTEPHTFAITYSFGRVPPALGAQAAGELACELLKACNPSLGECRLPKRVTSVTRQGVSMIVLDPFEFLKGGKTGLYLCDLFIGTYNPQSIRREAAIYNPDTFACEPRRTTWPEGVS